jgi:hypothetical protein
MATICLPAHVLRAASSHGMEHRGQSRTTKLLDAVLLQWTTANVHGSSPLDCPWMPLDALGCPWMGKRPSILCTSTPELVCLCTYEYTSTPSRLAIITVLCADLHRYLSRMCGEPPPDIILLHYSPRLTRGGENRDVLIPPFFQHSPPATAPLALHRKRTRGGQ